jgi:hypothetical protein
MPVSDAIRFCAIDKPFVSELRIFALTTGVMLPVVRGLNFNIGTCQVFLPYFAEATERSREARNNALVAQSVAQWRALVKDGRIRTLDVRLYDSLPSHYCMIFDRDVLLVGTFVYREWDDATNHDFGEPFVTHRNTANQAILIENYISWFDSAFARGAAAPKI